MDGTEDDRGRWAVHGERTLYDNPWVRLDKADITTPSGNRFEHHTVTLPSAAVIAILDRAEEHVLMSYRHRFVPDVWGWELPGGLLDPEETPERTAIAEATIPGLARRITQAVHAREEGTTVYLENGESVP